MSIRIETRLHNLARNAFRRYGRRTGNGLYRACRMPCHLPPTLSFRLAPRMVKALHVVIAAFWILAAAILPAQAAERYIETPSLAAGVTAGRLSPVEKRLPDVPLIVDW